MAKGFVLFSLPRFFSVLSWSSPCLSWTWWPRKARSEYVIVSVEGCAGQPGLRPPNQVVIVVIIWYHILLAMGLYGWAACLYIWLYDFMTVYDKRWKLQKVILKYLRTCKLALRRNVEVAKKVVGLIDQVEAPPWSTLVSLLTPQSHSALSFSFSSTAHSFCFRDSPHYENKIQH